MLRVLFLSILGTRGETMKQFIKNMKHMFKAIHRSERYFWVYLLLQVITSTLVIYFGLRLTEIIVALVSDPNETSMIIQTIIFSVGILASVTILDVILKSKLFWISQRYRMGNLEIYMDHYIDTDYRSILDPKYQELMNATMNASSNDTTVDGAFLGHIASFLQQIIQVVLLGSLLSVLNVNFVFIIVLMIILTTMYRFYQAKVIESMRVKRDAYFKKINYLIEESGNFKVAKDMRLYGVKDWFNDIFEELLKGSNKILNRTSLVVLAGQILSGLLVAVLTGYGYFVLVRAYLAFEISLAELTFYISAISTVSLSCFTLVGNLFDIVQDSKDITPIVEFYSYPHVFNHDGSPFNFEEIHTIEFIDVRYQYPDTNHATFENFNLKINRNEKVAIVGLNGAGKSTLVKLLCNLLKPDSGQILINGVDNQTFNLQDYYQQFSVVFQEQFAMPVTIKETIIQNEVFDAARYQEVLEQSGVSKFLNQFPNGDATSLVQALDSESVNLSGGQHQKLKLAQALYKDGKILILDEPTAALDPISESEIYQNYFDLSKNKISLFITHRLASTQFCDRIIYIEQGKVKEDGDHQTLINLKGSYYDLFETQAYYYKEEINHA